MIKIISALSIFILVGCTQSESMELKGRVAMKGTSSHTYLTIYDTRTKKSYKILNKESFDLLNCQNQTIQLKAKLIKEAIGPGFPAVIEVTAVK